MELAKTFDEPFAFRTVEEPPRQRILGLDPRERGRIVAVFEAAKRIRNGDAVEYFDEIRAGGGGYLTIFEPKHCRTDTKDTKDTNAVLTVTASPSTPQLQAPEYITASTSVSFVSSVLIDFQPTEAA